MRILYITLYVSLLLTFSVQCGILDREQPIARVNDAKLTRAELEQKVAQIGSEEDYLNAVRKYVSDWVDRELLYQEALRQDIKPDEFMETELERIRKSMIVNLFIKTQINEIISVSDIEIEEYYETHIDEFIAETNYYKFEAIKTADAEFAKQLEKNINSESNIRNIFNNTPESCQIVSAGLVYLAETHIPPGFVTELQKHKSSTGFFKFTLKDETYFIKIVDILPVGEKKAFEMVEREIKQMLIYKKRQEKYNDLISRLRSNNNAYQINLNFPFDSKERG